MRTHFPDRPAIAEPRLQVRNAQAPTRICCCAMSGYGEPRGLSFGCASVCEHSEIGFILIVPSSHSHYSRPPCTYSGRAGNACTNLLGFLVRYVRTRGIAETVESAKPPIFDLSLAVHTCHALLLATNSCTPRWFGRRTA